MTSGFKRSCALLLLFSTMLSIAPARAAGLLGNLLGDLLSSSLVATPGTASSEGYVVSAGVARRYIVIRPATAVKGAPMLVLLHPSGVKPELMANITRAGRLASQYGAWVYLPEGQFGKWNENPKSLVGGPDDVAFIRSLIDSSIAANGLDAKRVFIAGYSNGGFMAERAGCELSTRIAGIATVAASLRDVYALTCHLTHAMPVIQFHGTGDLIVPYRGNYTLEGAVDGASFWAAQDSCPANGVLTRSLPDVAQDGTSVAQRRYGGCRAGTEVQLYTIDHGGHTWPGSTYGVFTLELGRTSQDIDATLELWKFFSPYSLK